MEYGIYGIYGVQRPRPSDCALARFVITRDVNIFAACRPRFQPVQPGRSEPKWTRVHLGMARQPKW